MKVLLIILLKCSVTESRQCKKKCQNAAQKGENNLKASQGPFSRKKFGGGGVPGKYPLFPPTFQWAWVRPQIPLDYGVQMSQWLASYFPIQYLYHIVSTLSAHEIMNYHLAHHENVSSVHNIGLHGCRCFDFGDV